MLNGLIGEARRAHTSLTPVEPAVNGEWLLKVVADAIDATSSQKAAAIEMGQDRSQLNNQLKGNGNLFLERVGRLSPATLLAIAEGIRKHCGAAEDPVEAAKADAELMARLIVRMVSRVR